MTISKLIIEYFKKHPKQDLNHGPIVDSITKQWLKTHKEPPRDPWRAIRKLYEEGILIKVKEGIYKYDPDFVQKRELEDFTPEQKELILKRDGYKCVQCGIGRDSGLELHVDHIKAKAKGGAATIENGQTMCSIHNFRKKNYGQTESGKKMLIRLYELAKTTNDTAMINFARDVLRVFDKHNINGHIPWEE